MCDSLSPKVEIAKRARKERRGLILEGAYIKPVKRRRSAFRSRVAPLRLAHIRIRVCTRARTRVYTYGQAGAKIRFAPRGFQELEQNIQNSVRYFSSPDALYKGRRMRYTRERTLPSWQNSISKSLPRRSGRYR